MIGSDEESVEGNAMPTPANELDSDVEPEGPKEESNYVKHAKRELKFAGYDLNQTEEDPNKWICENLLELLNVFAEQGHSGFSAPYCVSMFKALASFEPLSPLTGEDSEWMQHDSCGGTYQNIRFSAIFKGSKDGQAYWSTGRVFKDKTGSTYTSRDSRVEINFPWTYCKPEIVDAPEED